MDNQKTENKHNITQACHNNKQSILTGNIYPYYIAGITNRLLKVLEKIFNTCCLPTTARD